MGSIHEYNAKYKEVNNQNVRVPWIHETKHKPKTFEELTMGQPQQKHLRTRFEHQVNQTTHAQK